ncbi:imelysin family protein [Bordetella genomosp. 5]|uniref:Aminopeptidase n=1 Tax=Bordetella genomosp. 5 TaxID=1395608 RepID=A0A261TAI4_9BORD|nr:imelysin family protein [Bordetella genomosp. 5]OZI46609.1 aminopeptidase [Bordetella genomosp. 5]
MAAFRSFCVAATLSVAAGAAQAAVPAQLGSNLANGQIRPAFNHLAQQAIKMRGALDAYCAAPGKARAEQVDTGWKELVEAWGFVEFLRFGPLVEANRFERMAFWPDTRGVMPRQVQALLKEANPALLAEGALASRSVAVQGLPALEYVLYGEPELLKQTDAKAAGYACGYAKAVAGNVSTLSAELKQAWSDEGEFGRQFTRPAPANDLYRSQQEVAAEAMKAISTGLQFARDIKLMPVLGDSAQAARPKRAIFWRSGQSFNSLVSNLRGIRAFYQQGQFAFGAGSQGLDASLRSELDTAIRLTAEQPADTEAAVTQEATRADLMLAVMVLKNLKDVVDQNIAPALGVTIGFNALDGD